MMYKERRDRILASLPTNAMAVFMSGRAPYSVGDEQYPFAVERDFYYLTGLDYQDMTLVLLKTVMGLQTILFIPPFDAVQARWIGGRLLGRPGQDASGIDDVRVIGEFAGLADEVLTRGGRLETPVSLWGDLSKQRLDQPNPVAALFDAWRHQQPDIEIHDIHPLLAQMRGVKEQDELDLMAHAIAVTNQGIKAMMGASRPFIMENELEAYFDFVLKSEQCGHAFASIVAAGRHATTLHYSTNDGRANTGDLVLCDLGASYKLYCADITRTFPVDGRFTARQKQIYDIVLRANKLVIGLAGPGRTVRQLNQAVVDFYQQELAKADLLKDGHVVRDYYFHGVSHMLGLETHDVADYSVPLAAGNVITVEPGLYIEQEGLGIRIEDDVLITEQGCEVLSKDIAKEIDEIEYLMGQGR